MIGGLPAICMATLLAACAAKTSPAAGPDLQAAERLAAADADVRAGCLDCLMAAYREYDVLRSIAAVRDAATSGAIRAAALVALRERELGMVDDGYLERARALAASQPDAPVWLSKILDVVEALAPASVGAGRPTTDAELEKARVQRARYESWANLLRSTAGFDEAGAYTWLSLMCGASQARTMTREALFEPTETFADTPLLAYRQATCRVVEPEKLQALVAADARFVEVAYWLGLFDVGRQRPADADKWFEQAYAWRPAWPTLTLAMANIAMTVEEFDRALKMYDATLGPEPLAVDGLLGRVRALTYLGRNEEAVAATDRLLGARWYVGDARYWRALNETELARYDEAWADVELASALIVNAEVPKLAGIIAYRRHELEIARVKFDESRQRNPSDCETGFYLGIVLADGRQWPRTAQVLTETATCLQSAEQQLSQEIDRIGSSDDPPSRKSRQIAKRERQIAAARRMLVTSWFNTAVAYYSLSRTDDARLFAEKVAADDQFGERARDLLARLR